MLPGTGSGNESQTDPIPKQLFITKNISSFPFPNNLQKATPIRKVKSSLVTYVKEGII